MSTHSLAVPPASSGGSSSSRGSSRDGRRNTASEAVKGGAGKDKSNSGSGHATPNTTDAENHKASASQSYTALIPQHAYPLYNPSNTTIHHFTVSCEPYKMLCNSNSLIGPVLDSLRVECVRGLVSLLTTRLNKVRAAAEARAADEARMEKAYSRAQAEREQAMGRLRIAVQKQQEAKLLAEQQAAAEAAAAAEREAEAEAENGGASGRSPSDSHRRMSPAPGDGESAAASPTAGKRAGSAGKDRDRDKEKEKAANAATKKGKADSKKGDKGRNSDVAVEEPPARSAEEDALIQLTAAAESAATEYSSRRASLAYERDVATAEERQLSSDLAWVKQLQLGAVVPQPPPINTSSASSSQPTQPSATDPSRPSSSLSSPTKTNQQNDVDAAANGSNATATDASTAQTSTQGQQQQQPSQRGSTPAMGSSALRGRKAKAAAAAAAAAVNADANNAMPPMPALIPSPLPTGAAFVGVDLIHMQQPAQQTAEEANGVGGVGATSAPNPPPTSGVLGTCLNLRFKPLAYANQFLKPGFTYQLVGVFFQPPNPSHSNQPKLDISKAVLDPSVILVPVRCPAKGGITHGSSEAGANANATSTAGHGSVSHTPRK